MTTTRCDTCWNLWEFCTCGGARDPDDGEWGHRGDGWGDGAGWGDDGRAEEDERGDGDSAGSGGGNDGEWLPQDQRWLEALELEPPVDADQVKRAHRAMARTHHPDAGGSSDRFRLITEAKDGLLQCVRDGGGVYAGPPQSQPPGDRSDRRADSRPSDGWEDVPDERVERERKRKAEEEQRQRDLAAARAQQRREREARLVQERRRREELLRKSRVSNWSIAAVVGCVVAGAAVAFIGGEPGNLAAFGVVPGGLAAWVASDSFREGNYWTPKAAVAGGLAGGIMAAFWLPLIILAVVLGVMTALSD